MKGNVLKKRLDAIRLTQILCGHIMHSGKDTPHLNPLLKEREAKDTKTG
jgi:hypothetical protein